MKKLTKKEIQKFSDQVNTLPIGTIGICNFGGIEILATGWDDDNYVVACYNFGEGRTEIRRHKIQQYVDSGRFYFRKGGTRYYLDEIFECWNRNGIGG